MTDKPQIVSETIRQLGCFKPFEYRNIKVFRSPLNMFCVKQYVVLLKVEHGSTLAYDVIFWFLLDLPAPTPEPTVEVVEKVEAASCLIQAQVKVKEIPLEDKSTSSSSSSSSSSSDDEKEQNQVQQVKPFNVKCFHLGHLKGATDIHFVAWCRR